MLGVKAVDKEGHESLVSPYVDLPFVRRPIWSGGRQTIPPTRTTDK